MKRMKPHRQRNRLVVIQSSVRWLTQPMTWLYVQTKFLPASTESHILCRETHNLDQFAMPHIHSFGDGPMPARWFSSRSWQFQMWRRSRMFDGIVKRYVPE